MTPELSFPIRPKGLAAAKLLGHKTSRRGRLTTALSLHLPVHPVCMTNMDTCVIAPEAMPVPKNCACTYLDLHLRIQCGAWRESTSTSTSITSTSTSHLPLTHLRLGLQRTTCRHAHSHVHPDMQTCTHRRTVMSASPYSKSHPPSITITDTRPRTYMSTAPSRASSPHSLPLVSASIT